MYYKLNLKKFFYVLKDEIYAIMKFNSIEDYSHGSDLDIFVKNVPDFVKKILSAGLDYLDLGYEIKVMDQLENHTYIDFLYNEKIAFRFDLYENFEMYKNVAIEKSYFIKILEHSIKVNENFDKKDFFISILNPEDELVFRYLEYVDWFEQRPDKIKHLSYILKELKSNPSLLSFIHTISKNTTIYLPEEKQLNDWIFNQNIDSFSDFIKKNHWRNKINYINQLIEKDSNNIELYIKGTLLLVENSAFSELKFYLDYLANHISQHPKLKEYYEKLLSLYRDNTQISAVNLQSKETEEDISIENWLSFNRKKILEECLVEPVTLKELKINEIIEVENGNTYKIVNGIPTFQKDLSLPENLVSELEFTKRYISDIRAGKNPKYNSSKLFNQSKDCWEWSKDYLNNDTVKRDTKIVCIGGSFLDDIPHVNSEYKFNVDALAHEYSAIAPEILNANTNYISSKAESLPFANEFADFVYTRNSIDHVANPVKVLKEIYRILKHSGKLLLGVYYNSSFINEHESTVIDEQFLLKILTSLFDIEYRAEYDVPNQNNANVEQTKFLYVVCKKREKDKLAISDRQIEDVGEILYYFQLGIYHSRKNNVDKAYENFSASLKLNPVLTSDAHRLLFAVIQIFAKFGKTRILKLLPFIRQLLFVDIWRQSFIEALKINNISLTDSEMENLLPAKIEELKIRDIIDYNKVLSLIIIAAHSSKNISTAEKLIGLLGIKLNTKISSLSTNELTDMLFFSDSSIKANLNCTTVVFSKDRPLQLDGLLRSYMLHCEDFKEYRVVVIYKASTPQYQKLYNQLINEYSGFVNFSFLLENNFKTDLLKTVHISDFIFFLVDDNLFVRDFSITKIIKYLKQNDSAIGYSLRLGTNTTYCYSLDLPQKLPVFKRTENNFLIYDWTVSEYDFNYPLEISSSILRSIDIIPVVKKTEFVNPNTLESSLDSVKPIFSNYRPNLICSKTSVAFCVPLNKTQTNYNNRSGNNSYYSIENLAKLYENGKRIDIHYYTDFKPDSCHQELELKLIDLATDDKKREILIPQKPLFSVIIANYNSRAYIDQAIQSVLIQTFKEWELIIVDDSSTDDSIEIINNYFKDPRVKLIKHAHNKGYTNALKTGIGFINSKYFGILDSDDILLPDAVENMYKAHIQNPDAGLIYSQFVFCNENLRPDHLGYCKQIPSSRSNLDIDGVSHFKTFKWEYYNKTSGYDELILYAEDKDISYKMEEVSKLKFIDKILYCYRVLPNSQSNHPDRRKISLESMKKAKFNASIRRNKKNKTKDSNEFRLSVIITTYNRIEFLNRVLNAFATQTASTDQFEIIVVDDGSEPKAENCVNNFKDKFDISYIYHPNKGLAYSRNKGIENAKYEIVVFADDDDIPSPNYIQEHLNSHKKYPEKNIAVLGKLDWHNTVHVSPFMDYITRINGDYFNFENLVNGQFYDVWKWWGGLISCKKELLNDYYPVFDEAFTFGYEDTDLAIRMMDNDIKILYNANAKSYIIKEIGFDEFLKRCIKQGKSLYLLEKKHGEVVKNRYLTEHALDELEISTTNLNDYKNQVLKLDYSMLQFSPLERMKYLDENSDVSEVLYKLYSLCIRGNLLKGYYESYRSYKVKFKLSTLGDKKLNIGLHSQTLHRHDSVVAGSEITTKGLKKAFEKYSNVEKVIRYGTNTYSEVNEKLDLVIIEGWDPDVPLFIDAVKKKNKNAVILFWNLSFLGIENLSRLSVDGFLTNSDKMLSLLSPYAPVKKVLLAADTDELFPTNKTDKYNYDVVYLGMFHPHKSEEIISRMLIEACDFNLAIYGNGWDSHPYLKKYWKGKLPDGEINSLYSSAKIVIGTTEDRQREAGMINNRVFEVLACGSTFISEYFPELESVFGDLIFYSKNKNDTRNIISDILSDKLKRKNPAEVREFIVHHHTYDKRVKDLFDFYFEIVNNKSFEVLSSEKTLSHKQVSFISICIPTYNRAHYLKDSIRSVLNQKYDDLEIIVVDDGSTDNTKEIVNSFNSSKINYIKIEHSGAPIARNKAIENAKGEYILWLDSDDVLEEKTLQLYLEKLKYFPDVDIIYGDISVTDNSLTQKRIMEFEDWNGRNEELISRLFFESPIPHPAVLIKKELYNRIGNYDIAFKRAHDYEWWTRAASIAKFVKIDSVVCKWRWHDSNMSSGSVNIDTSYDEMVIRRLLSRFNPEQLFPSLRWDSESKEHFESEAYLNIAKRFIELKRYKAALEYVEKSYKINPEQSVFNLISRLKESVDFYYEKKPGLKILFVVHNFPPYWYAGIENYTYSIAKSLLNEGINVSVLYPQSKQDLKTSFIEEDTFDGIKIIRLMKKVDKNPVDQIINEVAENLFDEVLVKEQFDVVHFHHLMGLPFSFVEKAKEKCSKVVITLHDFWTVCFKTHLYKEKDNTICSGPENIDKCTECLSGNSANIDKSAYRRFLSLRKAAADNILRKADLLIAPSQFVADKFKSFGYSSLIKAIPLGINNISKADPRKRKKVVLGFIGTISKLKNVDLLINSFVASQGNITLKIFGNGEETVINDLKKKILTDKRISYHGSYKPDDLQRILSEIDILVVPSLIESYSIVVREALSAGIPVVASNVGGIPEIVENNVNGLLFNSNNKVELSNIIKKIENNPSLIDKLKKGIKPVKSIKQESEELISEYKNLTENRQTNISIIIPVFNKLDYTKKCITSLYLNTPGSLNFEIIVVDNGSSDGTKEYLEKQKALHKNLIVIINEKNEGFAKANNIAVSKSKGSNLVFLNNDTEVKKGWLENLLTIIENDPKVGAVGSKLLYPDGTIQHAGVIIIENPEKENSLVASHIFVNQPSDFSQANELRTYQASTAACLLVKKNIFLQAGGFDEKFWNGYEDVDLCFKIGELDYKIVYQPESIVIHHESKSGSERFSKVANNVQLLNKKWFGKIKADFRIDKNNQLIPSNAAKIQNYKPEYRENINVSLVALTYNQLDYTKSFIQSLYQNTNYPFELIIVDNHSKDNTIKFLKELEKTKNNVKLILNENNLGFPKGVNQGIKKAAGNYILIANNDIVLTKGWLARLIEIAESDTKIGLVGPRSNSVSGMQLDKEAKYGTIIEMHNYAGVLKQNNNGRLLEFPRVAFLCTLIKKEVIEKIGGLDERFSPGNFEDDDFCLRAQLAGFKTVIAQDVFIHHYGSKSFTAEGMEKYKARLEVNQKVFVDKWGVTPEEIWLHGKQIKGRNIMFTLDKNEFTENLQRALSLIEEKDYEVALDYLKNSVKQYNNFDHDESDPELTNLLNLAGNVSLLNGNLETAQKYFENALKEDNNSSKACTGLGEVLFAAENYEAAKTMYEWGVKNNPDDIAAVEGLAKVNKIFNLPENDNSLFNQDGEEVLVDNSNVDSESDADELINEAFEMFNEKRFTEALDKLSQAEKIFNGHLSNPDDKEFAASFYNMKGFNYLGLNDIDKAKSCFQKALEINPSSSQACAGLGEILYLNKYDEQAKIMFEKAVEYNPENLFAVAGLEKVNKILNSELIEKKNNSNDKLKIFHRDDFGRLFNELKLDGRGAEIGVQRGKYSQILRDTWKGKELYLIDRWKYYSGNKDVANVADDEQKKLYISVVERFIDDGSVQIIRKDSVEASKQFPDEYFDWIYLDADHSYKGCLSDLKAWYPKLKKGGVFAGHDYVDGKLFGGNFKVKSAVDEFIKDKKVNLYQTEENTLKSWYFIKPAAVSSVTENRKNKTSIQPTEKEEAKLQSVLNEILEASYELFSLKHYDEAIDSLSKSEELFYSQNDKDLISAYENMKGFNYLGLDDKSNAGKCFETALNINPESSQACAGLGELFYLKGKDKEAKTMYEFAVKNNPENPYAISGLEKVNKALDYPETHNTLLNY